MSAPYRKWLSIGALRGGEKPGVTTGRPRRGCLGASLCNGIEKLSINLFVIFPLK